MQIKFGIQLSDDPKKLEDCSDPLTHVKQSIGVILETRLGERACKPEFGCRLHELLFELLEPGRIQQATLLIEEAIKRWEPRVDEVRVSFSSVDDHALHRRVNQGEMRLKVEFECDAGLGTYEATIDDGLLNAGARS